MSGCRIDDAGIEDLFHDPDGPVAQIIERKAYAVENRAKRLLLTPGTGGWYGAGVRYFRRGDKVYRWDRQAAHRASAPGEPASSDTGELLNTVGHYLADGAAGIEAHVGSPLAHAAYTELGTRYMAPRPWLRPALDAARS